MTTKVLETNSIDNSELKAYRQFSERLEKIENGFSNERSDVLTLSGPTDTSTWFASSVMKFLVACDTEAYACADVRPKMPFSQSPLGRIVIHSSRNLAASLAFIRASVEIHSEEVRQSLRDWEHSGRVPMDLVQGRFVTSARSLLKHATGWVGNDLEDRLVEVYRERSKVVL